MKKPLYKIGQEVYYAPYLFSGHLTLDEYKKDIFKITILSIEKPNDIYENYRYGFLKANWRNGGYISDETNFYKGEEKRFFLSFDEAWKTLLPRMKNQVEENNKRKNERNQYEKEQQEEYKKNKTVIDKKHSSQEKLSALLDKLTSLSDGIYDVTGIAYHVVNDSKPKQTLDFIKKYKKVYIGSAYETETSILFSDKPKKLIGHDKGSGFNYGSTNIIDNCPKSILILAQND